MDIRTIGVVGAGQMGNGIAHVAAQSGLSVVMTDLEDSFVRKGLGVISRNLDRGVEKGRITAADREETLSRIRGTTSLDELSAADLVVEAVVEKLSVKEELFSSLDRICGPEVILATNTSSISITKIASATGRPERVIGMHFMNPVPVMQLVEVIRGLGTSDETCARVVGLAKKLG